MKAPVFCFTSVGRFVVQQRCPVIQLFKNNKDFYISTILLGKRVGSHDFPSHSSFFYFQSGSGVFRPPLSMNCTPTEWPSITSQVRRWEWMTSTIWWQSKNSAYSAIWFSVSVSGWGKKKSATLWNDVEHWPLVRCRSNFCSSARPRETLMTAVWWLRLEEHLITWSDWPENTDLLTPQIKIYFHNGYETCRWLQWARQASDQVSPFVSIHF